MPRPVDIAVEIYKNNPFTSASGQWRTKSLFVEYCLGNFDWVLYTLKPFEYHGYPSIYKLYIDMDDLTEYEFATKYFGSWSHWKYLCDVPWFFEHVSRWREELDLKIKAKALRVVRREADKGNFQANKMLIERAWESTGPKATKRPKAGRPSDAEVKGELRRIALETQRIDDDFQRIVKDGGDGIKTSN